MTQCKPVACSLELVFDDFGKEPFFDRGPILPADFEGAWIRIPLNRMPKQMGQQEKPLLRRYRLIDVNL